ASTAGASLDRTGSRRRGPASVERASRRAASATASLWPLYVLIALAAAVRLATIDLQSFWFDEAFTPVYVIHPSFTATMSTIAKTENTPPLWYAIIWVWTRIFGTGVVSMRLPSAFFGIALVPVCWAIGRQLAGRRAATAAAALAAFNPLFVWYSQEARAYELFALTGALAVLCFLRAERDPSGRRMAAFALTGALAMLSHYFAVFLLVPMSLWLLRKPERWRVAIPAVAAIGVVGATLIPLVLAQGGNGTQWIGHWALSKRLEAIPDYYLTGYSGEPLGRAIELLVAIPLIAALAYGLFRGLDARERRGAGLVLALAASGVLIPIAIVALGADYLAPRNLIAAMVPVTIVLAVVGAARRTGRLGPALIALGTIAFLAICIAVDLTPRLERGDWKGVARILEQAPPGTKAKTATPGGVAPDAGGGRVIATVHLGSAPLIYYMHGIERARKAATVRVSEIDEVGYPPLLPSAATPPAPGFRLVSRREVEKLDVYRFVASSPRTLSAASLRVPHVTETGEGVNLLIPKQMRSRG
ncbi:MAG: glycosyltransferase family 39 protein, partial [Solirubrobacteraceae bacterium]